MSKSEESPLEFPCRFPIKAMGMASDDFESLVVTLVRRHYPDLGEDAVVSRDSSGGKYLSVTVTIEASSRQQLDNIYMELSACEHVLMAL
jgi:putative lipoic acid-binding regulatory protein